MNMPLENKLNDKRNVVDEFKTMSIETIRMSMDKRRVPAVNMTMNLTQDFNKSSSLRSSEAFAFSEFIFVNRVNPQEKITNFGVKKWDKRGSVGMNHYANIRHCTDWKSVLNEYKERGYKIFAVDNIAEYKPQVVYEVELPAKSLFVYGEEGRGLSKDLVEASDSMIYIPQYGIPRSLNIASAASIIMYEYARQNKEIYEKIYQK
jgi:tRNA G18 (ribose-2'-O)-methylase SpoU